MAPFKVRARWRKAGQDTAAQGGVQHHQDGVRARQGEPFVGEGRVVSKPVGGGWGAAEKGRRGCAYRAKPGTANPNLELIRRLTEAGAEVHVCSQALFGNHIERSSVAELVEVDLAALVTLANLQLRGYALIPE